MRLARNLAAALDPAGQMERAGLAPDRWQHELLMEIPHRALLCCCRQSGKSTTAAFVALHAATFWAASLILLVSPSLRQSGELFRKVAGFYHQLDLGDERRPLQESTLRLELANGSRIISLPGSEATIRGYSGAKLVIVDEAARVTDELMAAVRPTLATTNGKLIAMSTPWGKRGWFFKEWSAGGDSWRRFRLTANECPRITKEFLQEERRTLGDFLYAQEYECQFLDPESALFASTIIEGALSDEIKPLWG